MSAIRARVEQRISAQLAPLRGRYEALQPREQLLVGLAGTAIALMVLYLGVWQPVVRARIRHAEALHTARSIANDLTIAEAEVRARGGGTGGAGAAGSGVSLLTAVDQASKNGTLTKPPARLQPDGEKQARVWLEGEQFDVLLRWMYELQNNYGLRVDVADIERQPTPGLVNARLSLTRSQ